MQRKKAARPEPNHLTYQLANATMLLNTVEPLSETIPKKQLYHMIINNYN